MDPVDPNWLAACTTDIPVIPKTDLESYAVS